jgi:hydrogenase maturation protease
VEGSPARVVVLGFGNPLRGDDGVGWVVAETAAQRWPGRLLVRTGQQLVPEWAADLSGADVVYFVDASVDVDQAVMEVLSVDEVSTPMDSHDLSPARLMLLARAAFGQAPRGVVLHVPAVNFEFGDTLSPTAASGVRHAERLLNAAVESELVRASG